MQGKLILSDGTVFLGGSFGKEVTTSGEVVFNTGMVGYPESLTDPSYFGQILVLTYPLQGNYGVPGKEFQESKKIQVKGLIVQNYIDHPSHFESKKSLGEWLKEEGIPALQGIDTRELTTKLRQHGVMLGRIKFKVPARGEARQRRQSSKFKVEEIYDPNKENILPYVSCKKVEVFGTGKKSIVLIDCGAKENIVRSLIKRGVRVTRVPWDLNPLEERLDFDGVLVSNGPGDPKQAKETIENVKQILAANVPTFGICLGSQILSLAAGGETFKLKFGHRGQNQPVQDVISQKAIITSQNHGFAVDMKSMDKDWTEWFVNLNDGTNEGIRHKNKPFMAVQFHPEANPGPVEGGYLFDEFLDYV
ncbi:carbamoyl phosphate synthase small subunit [Candidatus Daviesbacteria bacterium RIFCSPHIGHO2_01_FULL_40_11]|uniref:Carbamoyl phosphate synthase small chain n=1 Tax=Candidatus Daviesbacteria bacterium RIFCSPHIGHO2_01_FULL_40_11 TaxID=1797762 RepID=A0A1F5JGK7_9BACT|nr:MAG: carbamoyl phosphate synthase small subunit [Candidatus Daviesbacteria bacterium RIFCSPHIGHO2_01_FULL_40_11]